MSYKLILIELLQSVNALREKMNDNRSIGDVAESANINQGRDQNIINNYVKELKASPKDVPIEAFVNDGRLKFFTLLLSIFFSAMIIEFSPSENELTAYQSLVLIFSFTLLLYPMMKVYISANFIINILSFFLHLKVEYKDGVLKYARVPRKFYSEIWDIKYKKSFVTSGATLKLYAMNENKLIPYSQEIIFKEDAKAKYIYDLFHSKANQTDTKDIA